MLSKLEDLTKKEKKLWDKYFEKLKEKGYRSCRVCKWFIRVDEGGKIPDRFRGFCIFGQNSMDYGLYISSSIANECESFLFDENNAKITALEHLIGDLEMKEIYKDKTEVFTKAIKEKWNIYEYLHKQAVLKQQFKLKYFHFYRKLQNLCQMKYREYQHLADNIKKNVMDYLATFFLKEG